MLNFYKLVSVKSFIYNQNLLSVATTSYLSVNGSRINRINVIYHVRDTEPQQASGYGVILNQTKYKDLTLSKTFFKKTINYKNFY